MKGTNHEKTNYLTGIIYLILSINFNINYLIILYFLYGLCILPLWYNCDNDKENSRSIKRWGPFKRIWRAFCKNGHRCILHSPVWGPIILCTIPGLALLPYVWHSHDFNVLWMLEGLVIATWLHILTDKISGVKTWMKNFLKKSIYKIVYPRTVRKRSKHYQNV
jgi:uncharacterized metal-binding protein